MIYKGERGSVRARRFLGNKLNRLKRQRRNVQKQQNVLKIKHPIVLGGVEALLNVPSGGGTRFVRWRRPTPRPRDAGPAATVQEYWGGRQKTPQMGENPRRTRRICSFWAKKGSEICTKALERVRLGGLYLKSGDVGGKGSKSGVLTRKGTRGSPRLRPQNGGKTLVLGTTRRERRFSPQVGPGAARFGALSAEPQRSSAPKPPASRTRKVRWEVPPP